MHYLIDGYNLFFNLEEIVDPLQEKREAFVALFKEVVSNMRLHISLIFDNRSPEAPLYPSKREEASLEIVYSPRDVSADDYIIELLRAHPQPTQVTVVTNDRELAREAKWQGAKIQSIEKFIGLLKSKVNKLPREKKQTRESSSEFRRLLKIFEDELNEN